MPETNEQLTKEHRQLSEEIRAQQLLAKELSSSVRGKVIRRAGEYEYIPLSADVAARLLLSARMLFEKTRGDPPKTFLEVGSGLGAITHCVETRWGNAVGIDIQQEYVRFSKAHMRGTFRRADALTFRGYKKFDIIYFYQPFYDRELAVKFCNRLARLATGVVVACCGLWGTDLGNVDLEGDVALWDGLNKRGVTVGEVLSDDLCSLRFF